MQTRKPVRDDRHAATDLVTVRKRPGKNPGAISRYPLRPESGEAFEVLVTRYICEIKFPAATHVERVGTSGQAQQCDIRVWNGQQLTVIECKNRETLPTRDQIEEIVKKAWSGRSNAPVALFIAVAQQRDAIFQDLVAEFAETSGKSIHVWFWNELSTVCDWPVDVERRWIRWLRLSAERREQANSVTPVESPSLRPRPRLSTSLYVERTLEVELVRELMPGARKAPGLWLVVGEAGCGKTSVLWHVAAESEVSGREVVCIHADDIADDVRLDDLRRVLFWRHYCGRLPLLFVDTADALNDLSREHLASAISDFTSCGIDVVVACRRIEARVFPKWSQLKAIPLSDQSTWVGESGILCVGRYDDHELQLAFETHARGWATSITPGRVHGFVVDLQRRLAESPELRTILTTPLTLRLLFELYSPDHPPPDSRMNLFSLYDDYWGLRVQRDGRYGSEHRRADEPDLRARARTSRSTRIPGQPLNSDGLYSSTHREIHHG